MQETIGKYVIQKKLGAGAFGNVYQALDPDLQKLVAIKKLKGLAAHAADAKVDTRALFTREAVETSKLSHPNIVTVHGFGVDENDACPYIVMEFLEGETLESYIRRNSGSSYIEKIEIMQQVAEGLQVAHTRGVRHRDIKPANIMILADGTAKVFDFAVAPDGFVVGTPAYMAPEQFRPDFAQGSDIQTDIFAYGAVYYEVLTGERAFDPERPERNQTSRYVPSAVTARIAGCPAWLDDVVAGLIAQRREDRVESLEEMLLYTRPIVQKLKQQRAAELAAGIPRLLATDSERAGKLIAAVLRLDPLNAQALGARTGLKAGQREQFRVRAIQAMRDGQGHFAAGDFAAAETAFEEALALDNSLSDCALLLQRARAKAEDQRMAERLVDEVLEDIIQAGQAGLPAFLLENVFAKLTRAAHLEPRCRDAIDLRLLMMPWYEHVRQSRFVNTTPAAVNAVYEDRLKESRVLRKRAHSREEFDHAELILRGLVAHACDDRAMRELSAVVADREAFTAAGIALSQARTLESRADLEGAKAILDGFAEKYPRRAIAVQSQRKVLEARLQT